MLPLATESGAENMICQTIRNENQRPALRAP